MGKAGKTHQQVLRGMFLSQLSQADAGLRDLWLEVVALQTDNTGKIAWDAVIKHKSAGDSNHQKTR